MPFFLIKFHPFRFSSILLFFLFFADYQIPLFAILMFCSHLFFTFFDLFFLLSFFLFFFFFFYLSFNFRILTARTSTDSDSDNSQPNKTSTSTAVAATSNTAAFGISKSNASKRASMNNKANEEKGSNCLFCRQEE